MKRKETPFIIALAAIALILSAFSTFSVIRMQKGSKGEDKTFKADVYKVIDAYIAEKSGQAPQPTGPVDVSVKGAATQGSDKAPVTLVEFCDFQCPFCDRYFKETYPEIIKKYVDTGKVKYVFRNFPLPMHTSAAGAANAAECVREQGGDKMFFEYHDLLFANQSDLTVPKLKEYAANLQIDQAKFAACVDGNNYAKAVDKDFADGGEYGVRGTPAFFINGMSLSGAQPLQAFETAIDEALNK